MQAVDFDEFTNTTRLGLVSSLKLTSDTYGEIYEVKIICENWNQKSDFKILGCRYMNNYCLRNWRLVKTGINSSKNYWKLNGCLFCILQQTNFVRFFKVRSLIKTRYGPCMELSPERVTTTKELSGQKLRKFSCEFCLEPFWWDYTTRDVTHK